MFFLYQRVRRWIFMLISAMKAGLLIKLSFFSFKSFYFSGLLCLLYKIRRLEKVCFHSVFCGTWWFWGGAVQGGSKLNFHSCIPIRNTVTLS